MNSTRGTTRHLVAAMAAGFLVLLSATSVLAQDIGTNFTVSASSADLTMSFSSTTDVAVGSTAFDEASDAGVSATLSTVTVTDDRGDLINTWALGVSSDDWSDGEAAPTTVSRTNGLVFVQVDDLATLEGAGTDMDIVTCVCGTDGSLLWDDTVAGVLNLGSAGYNLVTGVATSLPGTATSQIDVPTDIYVNIPAGTPVNTYSNTVTFDLS